MALRWDGFAQASSLLVTYRTQKTFNAERTARDLMVKLTYCICRKPGLSREEFIRYWADVHGPIGARIPGVRKLVQSHALAVAGDTRPPDFDGMAELWFDDLAAMLRARESAEWAASTADEANFVDPARTAYFVSEERQVL